MSGHSKWSQIKRQKGAADVKRGQLFSKLTLPIILAARSGGGDPEANFSLKMAIERARTANMPKENIERAIERGTGKAGGTQIEEVLYEALGPAGISIIIEAATDNKNRTASEVKNTLAKFGGKLTGAGAASYLFSRMGKLLVDLTGKNSEEVEMVILNSGAEDFEEQDGAIAVYTAPNELEKVKKNLENSGIISKEALLSWEPKNTIAISDKATAQKIIELMDALDLLDEVSMVYSNFDVAENLIK
jgi:YebC/PmpR family DNA-binding regulatory protein